MVLQQRPDGQIEIGFTADSIETKQQIETIARLAHCVEPADVQKLLDQYRSLDTVGPIFDPTAYGRTLANKQGHERLARAFLQFRTELQRLVDPKP